jgi:Uncharacterized protein involved in methicillin resistance
MLVDDTNKDEYIKFLQKHPKGHFLQSIEWAKIKSDWKNEIIIEKNEQGDIVGSMSLLIRKVPFFGSIMYAPRGPVCDIYDKETFNKLVNKARELAKQYKSFIFRIDPDIKSDDIEFRKIAEEIGFKIKDNVKDFKDVIQPRYVFRLDVKDKTEEELMKSFHEKTRYNIRLSGRKGVVIKEGTREDLKEFQRIMQETGERDEFMIRPVSYFEKMYDNLAPNHMKLLLAYYEDKPIAGVIPIMYGNKVWYLYGASSNEYRNVMPNYVLQWEMIKIAINNKCDIYDFRGVSGVLDETHPQYGIYKFKKGFNGEFTEFMGELYIVFKPFTNSMFNFSERMLKKITKLKRKLLKK